MANFLKPFMRTLSTQGNKIERGNKEGKWTFRLE